ncbi:MAG: DUF1385 domain-containing protein [Coriobacteriales bacterium]|nr:DUF1385 domain-containing protein [Coriobacteriales bacterium]
MMRGKLNWAVAVRKPDGFIHVESHELKSAAGKKPWMKWPIVRGVVMLFETLALGLKAFGISAQYAGESEEEQLSSKEISFSMVFGVVLAVLLFIVAPAVLTNLAMTPFFGKNPAVAQPILWNVIDGLLRVVAFFGYIWAISRVGEIQRVFAYHGAEHKTIHAYEAKAPLDPKAIQRFGTAHVRCGTSFLLMVMIVALVVYSLIPVRAVASSLGWDNRLAVLGLSIGVRLLFLPIIAGLAYEVIKFAGSHSHNPFVRVLLWPGLMLQKMTTGEPDDSMVEVAVAAVLPVLEAEGLMEGIEVPDSVRESLAREAEEAAADGEPAEEAGDGAAEEAGDRVAEEAGDLSAP